MRPGERLSPGPPSSRLPEYREGVALVPNLPLAPAMRTLCESTLTRGGVRGRDRSLDEDTTTATGWRAPKGSHAGALPSGSRSRREPSQPTQAKSAATRRFRFLSMRRAPSHARRRLGRLPLGANQGFWQTLRVRIEPALIPRLNFKDALKAELGSSNRLFPVRWDQRVLLARSDEVANNIRNRLTKRVEPTRAETVFVDKNRRGTRPISQLSLIDRVLYRALVDLIAASMPAYLSNRSPHADFVSAPLAVDGTEFVSTSDVAAFYEYVDHDVLATELEAQSGEALAIDALIALLFDLMGRRVGIPQIHAASDVLGDTYIDVVRRRLYRSGFAVFTYSDDFRIATDSLASAKSALEMMAREARSLGLTLNESKTFTYRLAKYTESLEAFAKAEAQLFEETDVDEFVLIRSGHYELIDEAATEAAEDAKSFGSTPEDDAISTDSEPTSSSAHVEPTPAQAGAASRALAKWVEEHDGQGDSTSQQTATTESLLAVSLPLLGAAGDTSGLEHISAVLRQAPALTPNVAAYLTRLARHGLTERRLIRQTLDELVSEHSFSTWQQMWLAEAAGSVRRAKRRYGHYEWLKECLQDHDPALRAVAASALARLGLASADELRALLDGVGPAWRTLVLWAVAIVDVDVAEAAAEDKIERILVEEVRGAAT